MKSRAVSCILLFLVSTAIWVQSADTVLTWPPEGQPSLKFSIGKLRQVNSYSGQADYVADVNVTNMGSKPMTFASFYVYLLDKNQKRIGEGYIELSNVGPGQQVKVPLTAHAMGSVASMQLHPQHLPSDEPRKVTVNVASVPAGASFKVDGQDGGVTPKALQLVPGKHTLEFTKEGYATGSTDVEVTAGSLPSIVNYEMAGLSHDTVVLRDGTVLLGDVASVTTTALSVKVSGKLRKLDRNQVARVLFVERKAAPKRTTKGKR
ncbi:MAG TPA: PEGA domain-containing protein [Terriglobales bacterium]|nr:PEGA domain-containing protein [Terriglobales bacterium]